MKKRYRFFSLLEIMVGLTLVLTAAGAVGWKIHSVIEKHRFRADLQRFKCSLLTAHKMAVNMQVDWEGTLQADGRAWIFEVTCLDSPGRKPTPLKLHVAEVLFNGKKQDPLTLIFFSSGKVWPSGTLEFRSSKDKKGENWDLPAIFGKKEGMGEKSLGPVHPSEA